MDHEAFDRLTVAVGKLRDRVSRRDALRAVLGGALGVAVAQTGGETEARKRKHRKSCNGNNARCSRNRDCCSGFCVAGLCRRSGSGGGGGCSGQGAFCDRSNDCCSGNCLNNICLGGGGGGGGCGGQNSFCTRNSDCCSGSCFDNICVGGGGGGGCGGRNSFCDRDRDCCSGNCVAGICIGGGGGSCQNCGSGFRCCNSSCVPSDFTCCRSGSGIGAICPGGMTCCARDTGAGCCPNGQRCCSGNLGGGCCPAGSRCRSNGTCVFFQTAENGAQTEKVVQQTPRTRDLGSIEQSAGTGDNGQEKTDESSQSKSGSQSK